MWISVKDKETVLPSLSKVILVTDGQKYQLITVEKFLENVDAPYNTWTHWMKIPKIEELIHVNKEELNKLATEYVQNDDISHPGCAAFCAFKAGYRKAMEKLF